MAPGDSAITGRVIRLSKRGVAVLILPVDISKADAPDERASAVLSRSRWSYRLPIERERRFLAALTNRQITPKEGAQLCFQWGRYVYGRQSTSMVIVSYGVGPMAQSKREVSLSQIQL
jgi:hypothetical protein